LAGILRAKEDPEDVVDVLRSAGDGVKEPGLGQSERKAESCGGQRVCDAPS